MSARVATATARRESVRVALGPCMVRVDKSPVPAAHYCVTHSTPVRLVGIRLRLWRLCGCTGEVDFAGDLNSFLRNV
jgi:hypothetical protein